MLPITGTFLDEISHDIPHQNWSRTEWDQDFQYMKEIGIDTVILIRCGYKKWLTYPSEYLITEEKCYHPSTDLVDMFLDLAETHDMAFYFGLYDSGVYWWENHDYAKETEINLQVVEEVGNLYSHRKAFQGWYLSQEISKKTKGAISLYQQLGEKCKQVSNNLPTMISPYIDGSKAILSSQSVLTKSESITVKQHREDWNEIFENIKDVVNIVAFQDGQVDYHQLPFFLAENKNLAEKHGLTCWTNSETFDRDMPIKFLPIKWDKLKLKLDIAATIGIEKAITFEFSHFMSPQSAYPQAHHLYNRYKDNLRL